MAYINKDAETLLQSIADFTRQDKVIHEYLLHEYNNGNEEPLKAFADLDALVIQLKRKRKADNEKAWDYIKPRRKDDPNYARTPYVKKKDREEK